MKESEVINYAINHDCSGAEKTIMKYNGYEIWTAYYNLSYPETHRYLLVNEKEIRTTTEKDDSIITNRRKCVSALLGLALGDAMGVPLEFTGRRRNESEKVIKPIGYGTYNLPEGTWSDDTSMTICEMASYLECGEFDYSDIMNKFADFIEKGKFTATGQTFDVGRTCFSAVKRFLNGTPALDAGEYGVYYNGNGSLMRMLPIALMINKNHEWGNEEAKRICDNMSSLTHAHEISKLGCYIYVKYADMLLDGYDKTDAYEKLKQLDYSSYGAEAVDAYGRILSGDVSKLSEDDIDSSGYVVSTLEAALWSILTTENFIDAIVKAINLGNDADTVGAVTGSLAGIIYPLEDIPEDWLFVLKKREYLIDTASDYSDKISNRDTTDVRILT